MRIESVPVLNDRPMRETSLSHSFHVFFTSISRLIDVSFKSASRQFHISFTYQVNEHDVLRSLFLRAQQFFLTSLVFFRGGATTTSACDRMGCDASVGVNFYKLLRRRADNLEESEGGERGGGGGVVVGDGDDSVVVMIVVECQRSCTCGVTVILIAVRGGVRVRILWEERWYNSVMK